MFLMLLMFCMHCDVIWIMCCELYVYDECHVMSDDDTMEMQCIYLRSSQRTTHMQHVTLNKLTRVQHLI